MKYPKGIFYRLINMIKNKQVLNVFKIIICEKTKDEYENNSGKCQTCWQVEYGY